MLRESDIESFKSIAEIQADLVPGGAVYFLVLEDTIVWKAASKSFDMPNLKPGVQPSENGGAMRAIKQNKIITDQISEGVYGVRITVASIPILSAEGQKVIGAISIAFPRIHPVISGFDHFAPVFAKMFPEGAVIFATDFEKVTKKTASNKFDIPSFSVGRTISKEDASFLAMKEGKTRIQNMDESVYGVPVSMVSYPLFEECSQTIIGTLGLILPRQLQTNLSKMAESLNAGLQEISQAIEDMIVSSSVLYENEKDLNERIEEVNRQSEEIGKISTYITHISSQTNMLGLNASIEASRAGEAGKGFTVVAKEIRNLSEQSKNTGIKIQGVTKSIKEQIQRIQLKSKDCTQSLEDQTATTEEINASIQELTSLANQLELISKELQ